MLVTDHRLPEPVERWLIARLQRQTPQGQLWTIRLVVWGPRIAYALLLFVILAPYIDPRLVPFIRWPQYLLYGGVAAVFARWLPSLWQNWHDDKFPVIFIGIMILMMIYMMWNSLTM